jgi:hypothetical protein
MKLAKQLPVRIHDGGSESAIHMIKVTNRFPMCVVHDVMGEPAVNYLHREHANSLLRAFIMRNVNFRMRLAICYPQS